MTFRVYVPRLDGPAPRSTASISRGGPYWATSGLPSAASWPSGHVAADATLYGSVAAVVVVYAPGLRWLVVALPLVPPLVVGTHLLRRAYPTALLAEQVLVGMDADVRLAHPPPSVHRRGRRRPAPAAPPSRGGGMTAVPVQRLVATWST